MNLDIDNACQKMTDETIANAKATAAAIDREVESGRPLLEVIARYCCNGCDYWVLMARPYSKVLAGYWEQDRPWEGIDLAWFSKSEPPQQQ